jgi:hypothetical protein
MIRRSCFTLVLLCGAPVAAQSPAACAGPEFRAFDYWLGEWSVTDPDGKVVGSNIITAVSGGCAVLESWTSAQGPTGTSLNWYDPSSQRWTQLWVGAGGMILHLEGGVVNGAMEMTADGKTANGAAVRNRLRWTPLEGGKVRQHWEMSSDGGATWQTSFDGTYAKTRSSN